MRKLIFLCWTSVFTLTVFSTSTTGEREFIHPGLLHTSEDLQRMATGIADNSTVIYQGYDLLISNTASKLTWTPSPHEIVYRGAYTDENYGDLYRDAAAAYSCALRWSITGEEEYAEKAVEILNAWGQTCTEVSLYSPDGALAGGIYGYQLANAAELMRSYSGWASADFETFVSMMKTAFYTTNHDFLTNHCGHADGAPFWSSWDLCNLASMMAIGVLADDTDIFDEALEYFESGVGHGSINNFVWHVFDGENASFAQLQESGRDQAHTLLSVGLAGVVCQQAWNQGIDLYGYDDNRFMKGAEYGAKYNLGYETPFETYDNGYGETHTEISSTDRGNLRPIWEMLYYHYGVRMGLDVPNLKEYALLVRPEGGGGNYGSSSGGYDHTGYGTLAYALE